MQQAPGKLHIRQWFVTDNNIIVTSAEWSALDIDIYGHDTLNNQGDVKHGGREPLLCDMTFTHSVVHRDAEISTMGSRCVIKIEVKGSRNSQADRQK